MFISSTVVRCPNQCHSKRLKPKQQIPSVGLQYDRTEIPFVAVQHVSRRDQLQTSLVDYLRGDEPEMNL
jgi:hypothetical protein